MDWRLTLTGGLPAALNRLYLYIHACAACHHRMRPWFRRESDTAACTSQLAEQHQVLAGRAVGRHHRCAERRALCGRPTSSNAELVLARPFSRGGSPVTVSSPGPLLSRTPRPKHRPHVSPSPSLSPTGLCTPFLPPSNFRPSLSPAVASRYLQHLFQSYSRLASIVQSHGACICTLTRLRTTLHLRPPLLASSNPHTCPAAALPLLSPTAHRPASSADPSRRLRHPTDRRSWLPERP